MNECVPLSVVAHPEVPAVNPWVEGVDQTALNLYADDGEPTGT
jgi:hypothetical protein